MNIHHIHLFNIIKHDFTTGWFRMCKCGLIKKSNP